MVILTKITPTAPGGGSLVKLLKGWIDVKVHILMIPFAAEVELTFERPTVGISVLNLVALGQRMLEDSGGLQDFP